MLSMFDHHETLILRYNRAVRWLFVAVVALLYALLAVSAARAQNAVGTITWERPCEIGGNARVCRISIPVSVDPATGIGSILFPSVQTGPVQPLSCVGPFLKRESPSTITVGGGWSDTSPCRIESALWPPLATAGPFLVVQLTRGFTIQIPAGRSCDGWVWVDRGALWFSSGECQIPGALREIPSFGALVLGRFRAIAGEVVEIVNASVPELVHDSWSVRLRVP